jgi:hypothetical protein
MPSFLLVRCRSLRPKEEQAARKIVMSVHFSSRGLISNGALPHSPQGAKPLDPVPRSLAVFVGFVIFNEIAHLIAHL